MAEVFVGYGTSAGATAVLLLDAAEFLDLPADTVQSVQGGFMVPEEVATQAGVESVRVDRSL
jgi:hypothetical protein